MVLDSSYYTLIPFWWCYLQYCYLYWWYHSPFYMRPGIWFMATTTRVDFWTWIWPTRNCRLWQEVVCWFQCWKTLTSLGFFHGKKPPFKKNHILSLFLLLDYRALKLSLFPKQSPRRLELWFILWNSVLLRLLFIFTYLSFGRAWNTVAMSGLEFQAATWILD